MATLCPGCGRKLSFADWSQTCPDCGTNLMYHGFEERFFEDAKYAELGNAKVRVWWAKVMSCLFGGKLQVIRLCSVLLPVLALLVPVCKLHIELPLFEKDISLGLIGAINAITDGTVTSVFSLGAAQVTGGVAQALKGAYVVLGAMLLSAALIIVFELVCFLSKRVMSILLCTMSAIGIAASICAVFSAMSLWESAADFNSLFSASTGVGAYLSITAFLLVFLPNLILAIKGFEVKYREGDLYRVEVAKKLKHKEIKIEDLPQPIFETEEEKIARETAIELTMNGKSQVQDKGVSAQDE